MSRERRILVVEDDALMRSTLVQYLGAKHRVLAATSCEEAREVFSKQRFDVVILDLSLPDGDGLSLIAPFRQDDEAEVVVITAFPKVQSAVKALKAGALDYINKPFDLEEFDIVVAKALEHRSLRDEVVSLRRQVRSPGGVDRLLGDSPAIARVREHIRRVAATPDTTVLVRGESGTGKELVAEAVHQESSRKGRPFVRLNCSSIPMTMLEAELFGHERGAFTDAKASRRGLVEAADGGTLFLDEIGDLSLELQPKLLTLLESRTFRRIGGNREINADVRIVAATNRDLEAMVSGGRFREDLLFRLKVFEIAVPPLGDRRSDIPLLARHFVSELGRHLERQVAGFTRKALGRLAEYSWPGNVRELRNVIERAIILMGSETIDLVDLPSDLKVTPQAVCADFCPAHPEGFRSFPRLDEIERRYVLCAYRMAGHNKTRAAEILGISRVTLREKLKQLGVDEEGG
jgi:DNA-binding NtrC family response regulator